MTTREMLDLLLDEVVRAGTEVRRLGALELRAREGSLEWALERLAARVKVVALKRVDELELGLLEATRELAALKVEVSRLRLEREQLTNGFITRIATPSDN